MATENLETRLGAVTLVRPEDDAETVYFRAAVGTLEGVREPARFLAAALAGNRFGLGTAGGVLSLGDDKATVYLSQRLAAQALDDAAARAALVDEFVEVLGLWRERLSLFGKAVRG